MRLLGAIFRGFWVVVVVTIPSLLLPSAPQASLELSLIIGGIVGVFTIFEYGSDSPGFVDFRFAPPYNRFRVFTIAMQVVLVTLISRAVELNLPDAAVVDWAQQAAAILDFPYSPVGHAIDVVLQDARFSDTSALLLVLTASTSFVAGFGLTVIFAALLWLFRWPADRHGFNLWINLPMFTVREGVDIVKRLRRDAYFNIVLAVVLIYALPYIPTYGIDWFTTDIFENDQAIIWATTLWIFVSSGLLMRALAILRIAGIIARARR